MNKIKKKYKKEISVNSSQLGTYFLRLYYNNHRNVD